MDKPFLVGESIAVMMSSSSMTFSLSAAGSAAGSAADAIVLSRLTANG